MQGGQDDSRAGLSLGCASRPARACGARGCTSVQAERDSRDNGGTIGEWGRHALAVLERDRARERHRGDWDPLSSGSRNVPAGQD